jgi:branched-subunit amino acid ABC-type transport system permease component
MIASFALGIAMRETVRAIWGPSPFFYKLGVLPPWLVFGGRITPIQVGIIVAAVVAMVAFHALLSRTRLGMAMRATADNVALSQASGIPADRVIRAVWFIGAGFAACGGILVGLNTQVKPDMGVGLIIEVFSAAIVGGIGSPYGAILGAVLVAVAENVGLAIDWSTLLNLVGFDADRFTYIPTGYKAAVAFGLLIVTLLVRPRGLVGAKR